MKRRCGETRGCCLIIVSTRGYTLTAARRSTEFARLPASPLEHLEALEQLRALENGIAIRVVKVEHRSIGVDTEQDYERVKRLIEENQL